MWGPGFFLEPDLDFLPFYFFPTNRTSTDSSAFFVKSANALPIVRAAVFAGFQTEWGRPTKPGPKLPYHTGVAALPMTMAAPIKISRRMRKGETQICTDSNHGRSEHQIDLRRGWRFQYEARKHDDTCLSLLFHFEFEPKMFKVETQVVFAMAFHSLP